MADKRRPKKRKDVSIFSDVVRENRIRFLLLLITWMDAQKTRQSTGRNLLKPIVSYEVKVMLFFSAC